MPLVLGSIGLTEHEFEKLRLLLSVFQDGTGMLSTEDQDKLYARLSGRSQRKPSKNIKDFQLPYTLAQQSLDSFDPASSSLVASALD